MAIEVGKSPEDFKKEFLDPVSDSFCLAKWFEATIWLYIGQTASCHHNPTHKIKFCLLYTSDAADEEDV